MKQALTIRLGDQTIQIGQSTATVGTMQVLLTKLRVRITSLGNRLSNFDPSIVLNSEQTHILSMLLSDIEGVEEMLNDYTVAETVAVITTPPPQTRQQGHPAQQSTGLQAMAGLSAPAQQPDPASATPNARTAAGAPAEPETAAGPSATPTARRRGRKPAEKAWTTDLPMPPPPDEGQSDEEPAEEEGDGKPAISYTLRPDIIFDDDEEARKFFESFRWPNGVQCTNCNHQQCYYNKAVGSYRCEKCKQSFNVRTDTPMYKSKLNYMTWAIIMSESARPLVKSDLISLHTRLGVGTTSINEAIKKLREMNGPSWLERLVERVIKISQGPEPKTR